MLKSSKHETAVLLPLIIASSSYIGIHNTPQIQDVVILNFITTSRRVDKKILPI